ncbi:MAG: (2Fe-2S) ferredoxin domain-containing protein [Firmicutes bacterium]|nr:(2Fe-2S) ferredoxin domain-containing protein [Bacillota bacterium]
MLTVSVCVGSSCHLRGAYAVIKELQRLIGEYSLQDKVELKACFCLGKCQDGVSVMIDNRIYTSLSKENIEEFFHKYLL